MPSAFPRRRPVEHTPRDRSKVSLESDDASDVLRAMASDTARAIVAELRSEPATTSDVAEATDTSIQNAQYHLERLSAAGLVEAVDTWYSARGTEMTVYGLATERLVFQLGGPEESAAGTDEDPSTVPDRRAPEVRTP